MARIVFLGQKPVGERCFSILLEAAGEAIELCGAVSNPTEGVWWGTAAVHELCRRHDIPFLPNSERSEEQILDLLETGEADTLISVQHPWILSPRLLDAIGGKAFNLHNAPLPEYKGYNAANHAILNGESTFASTLHWMAADADEGNAAFVERFDVPPQATAADVYAGAIEAGAVAFRHLVDHLAGGLEIPCEALVGDGTFYPRDSLDGLRQIEDPADLETMQRKARAFHFPPFEPAYLRIDGRKYYISPG